MLHIPPTEPDRYVSSIVALNVHSPNGTGDWHSAEPLMMMLTPKISIFMAKIKHVARYICLVTLV